MNRNLILSISLHLGFFILLYGLERRYEKPPPPQVTYIEVRGSLGGQQSSGAPQSTRDLPFHGKPNPQRPALNLGLAPTQSRPDGSSSEREGDGEGGGKGSGSGRSDGYDTANAMDVTQEGKLYPYFDALWKKVNAVVIYPDDFVQQRITGQVTAQLFVDHRGAFTGEIRSIRGSDPMLNTYVLASLIHALRTPLPENSWMRSPEIPKSKKMLMVFQFNFNTFGPGGTPKKEEYIHFKNIFNFRRDAYVDPKLNQTINKIFTRYLPPIIPLPGAFYIDFPRAYEFFSNVAKPTLDPDQLRESRLKIKQEQWEAFIQEGSH